MQVILPARVPLVTQWSASQSNIKAVRSGDFHSLAVTISGEVWTWGYNNKGQLGNGNNQDSDIPVRVEGVLSGKTIVEVAAGAEHSLALDSDGVVYAWGLNTSGELGVGSNTNSNVPVVVAAALANVKIQNISAGGLQSFALDIAGKVWAWGDNSDGALGDGTFIQRTTPVAVKFQNVRITRIVAGGFMSAAIDNTGKVWMWGYNNDGELGNNSTDASPVPVCVPGISNITALACGNFHTLALDSTGTIYAWGFNDNGQIGDGSTQARWSPVLIPRFQAQIIAAGGLHSLAVDTEGQVWAWGYNAYGELGNASLTDSSSPVRVDTADVCVQLAAGNLHSLALTADNEILAWGHGLDGELGNATYEGSDVPVTVHM